MKYHDIQKPLVQSALVLLAILAVIGFVAGSGADSFLGGIVSILKGVIYTVLFAFALVIGLVFSVVLLIAIFLGAVSLYSSEKAKEMYANLRQRTSDLYMSLTNRPQRQQEPTSSSSALRNTVHSSSTLQEDSQFATATSLKSVEQKLSSEVTGIKQTLDTLNAKSGSLDTSFANLQDTVSSLPGSEMIERIDKLEMQQDKLEAKLDEGLKKLEKLSNTAGLEEKTKRISKEISTVQGEIAAVTKDLGELRVLFSESRNVTTKESAALGNEAEYRIFAYLEKEPDKKQFAKYIAEAIEKNMTYAEIDKFLSKSLPKKVDAIIKDHPSLTKEYIRECKNR
jgi:hypothetical protein